MMMMMVMNFRKKNSGSTGRVRVNPQKLRVVFGFFCIIRFSGSGRVRVRVKFLGSGLVEPANP
ncbi:hypothetical protein HanRHA438_Chr15g0690961 [Helianthus annuus]|nr:hypothetical protein HanRHA438_Chr15g0690961 [Helianthus annuus]